MKRQKKSPANEHAKPPALSAWKPGVGDGEKAQESHGLVAFLPSSWRHQWLLGLMLVAVTIMAYQPVWHAGFVWDDDEYLTDNPTLKNLNFKSADCLHQVWLTTSALDYYPMTYTMWWLEGRIWANHPLGYHLVNVVLHALSAVLLWRVFQRLKTPGALLAAAIFALHPVNVESVAWISEGKNALCMFFYAGTLLAWLKFEDSGRGRWYGLALAGFVLALLSKTAVAPLPFVLLGMAWWRRGRVEWKDVGRAAPFFVMAAALGLATVWFHSHRAIGHDVVRTDGFWSRLAIAGCAVWFYLYKAVLPLNLIFVYPRWQIDVRNVLSWLPLILLAAALVWCWHRGRGWGKALFFGLAYFVVMLLPILGFLNIYFMRYSLVADHWEYFAILSPITLAAAIIRRPIVAAVLLLALGVMTWKQCGMYASAETLWQTTLRLDPHSWMIQNELGAVLMGKGQLEEADRHFQKALEIKPGLAEAHNNLGFALALQGRVDEAIGHFQEALQVRPDSADIHNNLGTALLQKGRVDEAMSHFQKALAIDANFTDAHYGLGNAFAQKGKIAEAIAQYQQSLQIKPVNPEVQNNLAWLLATCPDAALRNGRKAVELAQNANETPNRSKLRGICPATGTTSVVDTSPFLLGCLVAECSA